MITRRRVILRAVALGAAAITPALPRPSAFAQSGSRGDLIDRWMSKWMTEGKLPVGALHVSRFVEPVYFLLKPIIWKPNTGQEAYPAVTVPKGFVTDFASIPSIFFSILRADGEYTYPAIIHDYLYWAQTTKRSTADAILGFAMEDFKVNWGARSIIYRSVRLGGGSAWSGNTSARLGGEKRVLKTFPDSPTSRWSDYKKDLSLFL